MVQEKIIAKLEEKSDESQEEGGANGKQSENEKALKKEGYNLNRDRELHVNVSNKKDVVEDRYQVNLTREIKEYSNEFSNAYVAVDKKTGEDDKIYAIVYKRNFPIRLSEINKLRNKTIKNYTNVLAFEMVNFSGNNGRSLVAIVEKPRGVRLKQYIKQNGAFDEDQVIKNIVPQINLALLDLAKINVVHGRVNVSNVYINFDQEDKMEIIVGECISEITGFSQPVIYETLNRAISLPAGKGNGDFRVDYFALGVLIAHLLTDKDPTEGRTPVQVLNLKLKKGTYYILTSSLKISPYMQDILRGTINDKVKDIWNGNKVAEWSMGRRFNLLPQASRVEATRPIVFAGQEFLNRKMLAHALYQNWDEAKKFVKLDLLKKWVERSVQDTACSDELNAITRMAKQEVEKDDDEEFNNSDELLLKTIIILDPEGPIRLKTFSANIDGIATQMAYAFFNKDNKILQAVGLILAHNLITNWQAYTSGVNEFQHEEDLFSLQKASDIIKRRDFGFGIERALYELNPTLPCQSEFLLDKYVLTVQEALNFLGDVEIKDGSIIDVMVAAFIANRLELMSPPKVKSIDKFPDLANNKLIQALAILSLAQERSKIESLEELSNKLNETLKPIYDSFYSKSIREEIIDEMGSKARQGSIIKMLQSLTDTNRIAKDRVGFKKAKQRYKMLNFEIFKLSNKKAITSIGYSYGLRLSVIASFLIASMVILVLIIKTF